MQFATFWSPQADVVPLNFSTISLNLHNLEVHVIVESLNFGDPIDEVFNMHLSVELRMVHMQSEIPIVIDVVLSIIIVVLLYIFAGMLLERVALGLVIICLL